MQKYWFKRKTYGWGWYPCSWKGVIVVILFILLSVLLAAKSLAYLILLVIILITICYKTGEKPRWQWGSHK